MLFDVQDSELLTELMSRFDHAIFVGMKCYDGAPDDDRKNGVRRVYRGNLITCAGLGQLAAKTSLDEWEETGTTVDTNLNHEGEVE